MDRRICAALGTALMLASCQQPEPPVFDVETSRTYAQDKRVVFDEILSFLEGHDLEVVGGSFESGVIHARRTKFDDVGWAWCERQTVTDRTSDTPRRIRANRIERSLDLRILLRESDSGTEVRLDPEFTERQNNPYTNLPFTAPCRSKGTLEAALLNAI